MHEHDSNDQQNVPIYLNSPCPSWCESWRHHVGADREDRFHESVKVELPASLADPLEIEPGSWIPNSWTTYLIQHVEAAAPSIWLGMDEGDGGFYMTLNEASVLAMILTSLVDRSKEVEAS